MSVFKNLYSFKFHAAQPPEAPPPPELPPPPEKPLEPPEELQPPDEEPPEENMNPPIFAPPLVLCPFVAFLYHLERLMMIFAMGKVTREVPSVMSAPRSEEHTSELQALA